MLVTITLTALTAVVLAAPALFLLGHRWRASSRALSCVVVVGAAVGSGAIATRMFALPSRYVLVADAVLVVVGVLVALLRPSWNPIGHVFFEAILVAGSSYLVLSAYATFAAGLSMAGMLASFVLLALETLAMIIAASFAFESIDVACRSRWARPAAQWHHGYEPFVSLHVPACNEPPDMLIETIRSLESIDYPNLEIIVVDNNTSDEDVWRPIEAYSADRPRVRFVHVDPWPGFKSGALNLALREYTAPEAEVVGVVDADYLVRADYLSALVGHFADPQLAFVQTPQDYREYHGDAYMTACYDSYRYFFETAMPSRNERNSIIFGGTMGLIRRSALEELGGWDEWCITEDAEASLRLLKAGYSGLYVNETFGRGIMPLTFTALKRQRFRWCFGGIQILRKHWRSLMPWDRRQSNQLSFAQRVDYLFGGFQWFGDLVGVLFTLMIASSGLLYLITGETALRPLTRALVLVPTVLIATGLLRALWALRSLTGISITRAVLAFATWLSLSWTTALACVRGLTRREGVFLRTPKWSRDGHLLEALREARIETVFATCLAALAACVGVFAGTSLLVVFMCWQAVVFASSPYMAWLNHRTVLSARLARRARYEDRRDRITAITPIAVRTGAIGFVTLVVTALFVVGATDESDRQAGIFRRPTRQAEDAAPTDGRVSPDGIDPDAPVRATTPPATSDTPSHRNDADTPSTTVSTSPPGIAIAGIAPLFSPPISTAIPSPTTTSAPNATIPPVTPTTSPAPSPPASGPPATRPAPPETPSPPASGPPVSGPPATRPGRP